LRKYLFAAVCVAVTGFLAAIPFISLDTHGVFSSALDSPGTLQLLALCLVFGGVALSYDLLFGFSGLLSFGHALYFATGAYMTAIATTKWDWDLWQALAFTAALGIVLPLVLGTVSLRVGGIAFAMVTLAFAQAGNILVNKNPHGWTGGEEGVPVNYLKEPASLVGVFNTKHLYWLALGYLVVVFLIVNWLIDSSPGRVFQAVRENEQRVEVLGLQPFRYKLLAFVIGSFIATAGGAVYALLIGGATPDISTASFTLTLLLMVVIGGTGTRWGAIAGGIVYTFLAQRLPDWSASKTISTLPGVLKTPLSQPLFVLGVLFILLVLFLPGGIAGLASLAPRRRGLAVLERAVRTEPAPAEAEEEPEVI